MSTFVLLSITGVLLFGLLLYLWGIYNAFIYARNQVKTDFADIDVQLKRRVSLIENLVEVVREYAKHEESTFENVAKARAALQTPHGPKETEHIDNMLSKTLRTLFAVSESYPKLRASENFQRLQKDLKETEDRIAQYREEYNVSVMDYNTKIQVFPNLLAAALFNMREEELFLADDSDREAPDLAKKS